MSAYTGNHSHLWGLYRTLSNVSQAGLLTEGFYWIPSLSGPASWQTSAQVCLTL